jgi:flagellin-like hook-associated protein FlgL
MSISNVTNTGSISTAMIQSLVNTENKLNQLQTELGTGQNATTYAGLGAQGSMTLGLDAQLSALKGYNNNITNVGNNISVAQTALTQIGTIAGNVKQAITQPMAFTIDNTGQTTVQESAASQLDTLLASLNTQAGNRYLFSGTAVNTPSVATSNLILNGNGAQAGLRQVIAERNQADLGTNGLGRLVIPASSAGVLGTGATLKPDQATGIGTVGGLTSDTTLMSLGVQQGDVITLSDGTNTTNYTVAAGATVGSLIAGLSNQSGGANVGVTLQNGVLQLQANNSTSTVSISDNSAVAGTDVAALGFGTGNNSFTPNTLISQGAVSAGQTLTIAVGANPAQTITFGAGPPPVTTLAQLNSALAALAPTVTASVNPANGNITIAAPSATTPITIGGTANVTKFGLQPGTANPTGIVTLSEDVAGSPFGFKLADVQSASASVITNKPSGSPAGISVGLTSNPNPGDTINFTFNLPDGTTESLSLAATSNSPPQANQFTIGATPAATAANLQTALTASVTTLAATSLSAASAMVAGQEFFSSDPPLRVSGPPFATATALVNGTTANTVSWYTGESGSTPARSTATAEVGPSTTVSYGVRANEPGLSSTVANIAVLAAVSYLPSDTNAAGSYSALTQRVNSALDPTVGAQSVTTIEADLANAQTTIAAATSNNAQVQNTLTDMLQQIENINQDQVAAQILSLQTSLQASMAATAKMAQISLVNYLPA